MSATGAWSDPKPATAETPEISDKVSKKLNSTQSHTVIPIIFIIKVFIFTCTCSLKNV